MSNKWLAESELALKAVSAGAEILAERKPEELSISTKGTPRDIVTDLDIYIEKQIKAMLGSSGYKMIGEESAKENDLAYPGNEPVWMIDPIDGTTNFISSIPYYSVSVGLAVDSRFPVGAVAIPSLKELFFTTGESGSYLNGKTLKVHNAKLKDSLVVASFSGSSAGGRPMKEYEFFGQLNDASRGCLRMGSASVNICYAATGRFKAAYGISNKIWDVAGALAIASRAGCRIYTEKMNSSFMINYVVGAEGAADELAEMIQKKGLAKLVRIN